MTRLNGTSPSADSGPATQSTLNTPRRVNWHEAAVCAIEIELRDFADILDFHSEYVLGKNDYRIDLLVIKALSAQPIPKNIARYFKAYNLFEIKGIHSSVTINAYYKTIGYAGLLLDKLNGSEQYTSLDVSVTFLSFHYPRNLIRALKKKDGFTIEKSSPGIYYIGNETFDIQIIVIPELPPEENLYLRCLAGNLHSSSVTGQLAKDYAKHRDEKIYNKYMHQLSIANSKKKGDSPMALVNEWIFELFGTSSDEIIAHAKQEEEEYYLPKLNEQSATISQQASAIEQLTSQIDSLKSILKQHNISYE